MKLIFVTYGNGSTNIASIVLIWVRYPPESHQFLLDLLGKFEVVFRFPAGSPLEGLNRISLNVY